MKDRYPGLYNDHYGGLTEVGRIILDAWVFGILPETETCEGWDRGRLQELYDKVYAAWEPYGHLVSRLPESLRTRHAQVYGAALERARAAGWEPPMEDDEDV